MSRRRVANPKTFRLTDLEDDRACSVYRIYSADDDLLYVGCASDVEHRIYMHMQTNVTSDAYYIQRGYARHTSQAYANRIEARAAERKAIATERPWFNRQHNPARWRRTAAGWEPTDPSARAALLDRISSTHADGWGAPDPDGPLARWLRGETSTLGAMA